MTETNDHFQEEILTADAAKKYHLTPSYVARLARTSLVQARKFGRDWILDEASLREYLALPRKPGPKPRRPSESQDYVETRDRRKNQIDSTGAPEEKLVVGVRHGESLNTSAASYDLYSLASPNANWLMELADIERFAVDDCILMTNSRDFAGWGRDEIQTTLLSRPLAIPSDLAELREEKLPLIEKDYENIPHYRLYSHTPSFVELSGLKITLAPLNFFDYYSLTPFLDEPLLTALDGSKISIRQKYAHAALTYTSTDRGMSLIPAPVSIQCIVVTKDQYIFLMQRSSLVAFYPEHWSASFEQTMIASSHDREGDADFFLGALHGLEEEFALPASAVEDIKVLSLNVEYLTLSLDVFTVIRLGLSAEEIRQRWLLKAWNRDEASRFALLSADLDAVVNRLFSRTMWHPTSRMRLIQFLFHAYGIDETARAIKEKKAKP